MSDATLPTELLPTRLAQRTRAITEHAPTGEFVMYWVRGAMRAWENPALDAAISVANRLGLPLFIYQALSQRYPWASDRHHTFILEGARDLSADLARRGLGYAMHLERPTHQGPHTLTLADRAALVITEDLPMAFLQRWADRLAAQSTTPVWLVDAACVVPMNQVGRAHGRAFEFRRAIAHNLADRIEQPWEEVTPLGPAFVPPDLPFEPLDLTCDLSEAVSQCDIDHTIGPVPHTRGGSVAGYARWDAFRQGGGLNRYAKDRNDPLRHGVSRMSAYLHHGMVAPTRLAREASVHRAEKFIDELVIWRELAWNFCRFRPEHGTLAALPAWARQTLAEHASDPRPAVLDRETLSRGQTPSALWNACQRSLLVHGELHNNVRMTWGKALIEWTTGPEHALRTLVDLNHRFALDGRDPASYGGLLWCLGAFDRPFSPATAISGTVRGRSVDAHEARVTLDRFQAHVRRPLHHHRPTVAVIGAGPAGAMCARTLADHGVDVVVYDKSRGAGGRMSTRRRHALRFDHGAPSLGEMPACLDRHLRAWVESGLLKPWNGPFVRLTRDGTTPLDLARRYVPTPSMNALPKHLLKDLATRFSHRATAIERVKTGVQIQFEDRPEVVVDHVLVCIPAPQAQALLAHIEPHMSATLAAVQTTPQWVGMAEASGPPPGDWSAAALTDHPVLSAIIRNQSKPGRPRGEQWVVHASTEWSAAHLEDTAEAVSQALRDALHRVLPNLSFMDLSAHRWRYSRVKEPVSQPFLWSDDAKVAAAGDGVLGDGVGAA
ncbi:MAG: NAD(P)-binding protein, partial [Myxococcota bacterium]